MVKLLSLSVSLSSISLSPSQVLWWPGQCLDPPITLSISNSTPLFFNAPFVFSPSPELDRQSPGPLLAVSSIQLRAQGSSHPRTIKCHR